MILKTTFNIIFLVAIAGMALGQSRIQCGTIDQGPMLERIQQNRDYFKLHPNQHKSLETIYIPVKFHLMANSGGDGRISVNAVLDQMCQLNEDFAPYDIQLYLDNNGTVEEPEFFSNLNNTNAFENSSANTYYTNNKDNNAINIYVMKNSGTVGNTTTAGFYAPWADYIVVGKAFVGYGENTLTHEIGHMFSLAHPHTGWEDDPWDRDIHTDTVCVTAVGGSQGSALVELVDRTNCLTTGDFICDTPPDYYFAASISGCNFPTQVWDCDGALIDPIENLFMGYYSNCLDEHFTDEQTAAMMLDFQSPFRANLRTGYVPTSEEVIDIPVTNAPIAFETTDYFDEVSFEWEAVANASHYYLTVSTPSGNLTYLTSETTLVANDLPSGAFCSWYVQPMNESSSCSISEPVQFFTPSVSTNVNEIKTITKSYVSPNPIGQNENLTLSIDIQSNTNANLVIYNISGQKVYESAVAFTVGDNQIEIPVSWNEKGLFVMKIETQKKVLTQNFIVE